MGPTFDRKAPQRWANGLSAVLRAAVLASGTKGDHLRSGWSEGRIVQLRVTRGGEPDTLAVRKAMLVASHRYEWIFVSTNPGNARIVFIDRVMSQPS
jgi:hypothetical protein